METVAPEPLSTAPPPWPALSNRLPRQSGTVLSSPWDLYQKKGIRRESSLFSQVWVLDAKPGIVDASSGTARDVGRVLQAGWERAGGGTLGGRSLGTRGGDGLHAAGAGRCPAYQEGSAQPATAPVRVKPSMGCAHCAQHGSWYAIGLTSRSFDAGCGGRAAAGALAAVAGAASAAAGVLAG